MNFANIVARTYGFEVPKNMEDWFGKLSRKGFYGYDSLFAYEKKREGQRLAILAENRRKFIDGPVLKLPNAHMNFVFNPNEVKMIDDQGPVYPTFSGTADWGSIKVMQGGAFVKDWMYVYVPLPPGFSPQGDLIETGDWHLQLKSGWQIKKGSRKGDFEVMKN